MKKFTVIILIVSVCFITSVYAAGRTTPFTGVRIGVNGLVSNYTNTFGVVSATSINSTSITGGSVNATSLIAPTATLTTVTKNGVGVVVNLNADLLDGYHASTTAGANKVVTAGSGTTIDLGWLPTFLTGKDADTVDNRNPGSVNGIATLDVSATIPLSQITTTLTGKSADKVDGYNVNTLPDIYSSSATSTNYLSFVDLVPGELILVTSVCKGTTGTLWTSATTELSKTAGTATIQIGGTTGVADKRYMPSIGQFEVPITALVYVTGAGDLQLDNTCIWADTVAYHYMRAVMLRKY